MSTRIDDRLKALGIELPTPSTPGANYVQFVRGEAGRHTRMAVGVSALPYDVAVEVEGIVEIL